VATVDNIDWPSKPGLSTPALKDEMTKILDAAERIGLNALIFQVRPSADAFYPSPYEPWSWYLSGEQGRGPEDGWDPLEWTIAEAHRRGLELHIWLNPYRAQHPAQKGPYHASHISQTHPQLTKQYGRFGWMDPGEEFVQDRSYAVFMDLVERYDIDGLHIDDYFYPYPVKANGATVPFPDDPSWQRARQAEPGLKRDDWRRRNVNRFVRRVHDGIRRRKGWVKFGISPFGIYRPGIPSGIRAGVDQYSELYADAKLWLELGWCDYFTPQLYWPIKQEPQSFPRLLDWWRSINHKKIHLWPGQFTSRTNPQDGAWKAQEVVDQIALVRDRKDAQGTVHFSMKALMRDWAGVATALQNGPYRRRAVVPASPWLDSTKPAPPATVAASSADKIVIARTSDEDARFVTVSILKGSQWELVKLGKPGEAISVPGLVDGMKVRVTVLDRASNESEPRVVTASR
jgi:uncharacterized lipoprotein YddW (UPF0748 family)